MTYSCAIFSDVDGDLRDPKVRQLLASVPPSEFASNTPTAHPSTLATASPEETLEEAQQRKLAHVVSRARILPGHRVIEIGSGWGSMALHIVRNVPDTQVDTITLSDNQFAHVQAEVARLGFSDRIRVHLLDYREMPREWEGYFDRVVSLEMVEAVGLENIDDYWSAIDRVLKKDAACGVIQSSTMPEASGSSLSIEAFVAVLNLFRFCRRTQDSLPILNQWTLSRNG
jgi:cyclopropane-fatty-acyl-phospholipid synthase